MDTKLPNEEIARIFALYFNATFQENISNNAVGNGPAYYVTHLHCEDYQNDLSGYKLILTPLIKMEEEKILELCKTVDDDAFGDYRYNKWQIIPQYEHNGKLWNAVDVKNAKSDYSYQVDLIDGQVTLYNEGEQEPEKSHGLYWQWYFKNAISIPIFPYCKTPIELGIAIDKTIQ